MRDIDREAAQDKRCRRVGEFLEKMDNGLELVGLDGGVLTEVRLRLPTEEEPSTLLIVKGWDVNGRHIAFLGGFSVVAVLLAWRARRENKGMAWKEDVPWGER